MEELFNCGFNDKDIELMIEINDEILDLSNNEIKEKTDILKSINCDEEQIKNILVSNPLYLNRCNEDILNLIKRLYDLKINSLNLLFDSNPWMLNKDAFEIDDFIYKKQQEGIVLEYIIDMLDSNPYIINEE